MAWIGLLLVAACRTAGISVAPTISELPALPPATSTPTPAPTPTLRPLVKFWNDPALPAELAGKWLLPERSQAVDNPIGASLIWEFSAEKKGAQWIYALVTPFPTIRDGVSLAEIQSAWNGKSGGPFGDSPLFLSISTQQAVMKLWGQPASARHLKTFKREADVLKAAWDSQPSWGIVPFEALEPRWKVMQIDGRSPLEKTFEAEKYPLTAYFQLKGDDFALQALAAANQVSLQTLQPAANLDRSRITRIVMTGVTAMVRATASRMEKKGVTYPGQEIAPWLKTGDIVHISNEISFNPECPFPDAIDPRLVFCSNPKYIGLLESVGANMIDMTGNHLNDFGSKWTSYTIDLYRQHGWKFFAAGKNLEEARKPALVEDHGNKLAFLGCNVPGPVHVWATADNPGAAPCDFDRLVGEISALKKQGYLPVVTMQYYEYYYPKPNTEMQRDFKRLSEAGAVIVSGSQAHRPAAFAFVDGRFIHFGLGNLFFDQMETPYTGTRQEFIDRHIIYNGKHISTELLTAMLEDYSHPRPMNQFERADLLEEIFTASGW